MRVHDAVTVKQARQDLKGAFSLAQGVLPGEQTAGRAATRYYTAFTSVPGQAMAGVGGAGRHSVTIGLRGEASNAIR
ncbi:MAG: hypothetical protein AAFO79_08165, partial [Pseudomonadota bacterium]